MRGIIKKERGKRGEELILLLPPHSQVSEAGGGL